MVELFAFDVTLKDLESLKNISFDKNVMLFDLLKKFLGDLNYEKNNIGTINVILDDKDCIHLDFKAKFSLEDHPEIITLFKKLKDG